MREKCWNRRHCGLTCSRVVPILCPIREARCWREVDSTGCLVALPFFASPACPRSWSAHEAICGSVGVWFCTSPCDTLAASVGNDPLHRRSFSSPFQRYAESHRWYTAAIASRIGERSSLDENRSCVVWTRFQIAAWLPVPHIAATNDQSPLECPINASFHCSWGWIPPELVERRNPPFSVHLRSVVCSWKQTPWAQLQAYDPRPQNLCSAPRGCTPVACCGCWLRSQSFSFLLPKPRIRIGNLLQR